MMSLSTISGTVNAKFQATAPPQARPEPSQVREQILATRAQAIVDGEELSVASMLYAYRNLPDADLRGLVEFAESDAGRWYHDTVWSSAHEALQAAAQRLREAVLADVAKMEAARAESPTP